MNRFKRPLMVLLGVVALLGAGYGISQAAIPDTNGVIHACYRTGTLQKTFYVINSPTQICAAGETALNFNQTGPRGPAGAAGTGGVGGVLGKRSYLSWGSIPEGGTPQLLFSVPNFGEILFTKCDTDGNGDIAFHNTTSHGIDIGTFPSVTIPAGATTAPGALTGGGFFTFADTTNSTTTAFLQSGGPFTNPDDSTCRFYGTLSYSN